MKYDVTNVRKSDLNTPPIRQRDGQWRGCQEDKVGLLTKQLGPAGQSAAVHGGVAAPKVHGGHLTRC
jgi:hypothetical protein